MGEIVTGDEVGRGGAVGIDGDLLRPSLDDMGHGADLDAAEGEVGLVVDAPQAVGEVGTSVRNPERVFKHAVSSSPCQYYLQLRLERAQKLLRHTALSVTQIAVACGFESLSHFSKSYSRHFAKSPTRDRHGSPQERARLERPPARAEA
jgi:AraC-like DNA-binding protein